MGCLFFSYGGPGVAHGTVLSPGCTDGGRSPEDYLESLAKGKMERLASLDYTKHMNKKLRAKQLCLKGFSLSFMQRFSQLQSHSHT